MAGLLENLHQWPGSRYPLYCANVYSHKNVKYFMSRGSKHTHTRARIRAQTSLAVSFISLPLPILSPRSQLPRSFLFLTFVSPRVILRKLNRPMFDQRKNSVLLSLLRVTFIRSFINRERNFPNQRINILFNAHLFFFEIATTNDCLSNE